MTMAAPLPNPLPPGKKMVGDSEQPIHSQPLPTPHPPPSTPPPQILSDSDTSGTAMNFPPTPPPPQSLFEVFTFVIVLSL